MAADPGLTNANMRLVMVEVRLEEGDVEPEQRLDDGENIERVMVPLKDMYRKLVEYSEDKERKYVVAAKLYHWAAGLEFAKTTQYV